MKKRDCEVSSLSSCVSLHWPSLCFWCQGSESRVLGLLGILLTMSGISESVDLDGELSQWCISLLSDQKHSLDVKAKVLELLPCFNIDQKHDGMQEKIRNALKAVFDQFCPRAISSSFNGGKAKRLEAEVILTRVFIALERTCSPMLLRFLIMASNGGKNHINRTELKKSLSRMMKRAKLEKQHEAISTVYSVVMDSDCDPTTRFGTSEVFATKLVETADYAAAINFFAENIKNIVAILQETLDVHPPWKLKHQLISKIICFQLVGMMFLRFNKGMESRDCPISLTYNDGKPNERQLIKEMSRRCWEARKMLANEPEKSKELFRKYRCAAYNATVAVVANLKDEYKFYALLFQENLSNGERIWDGLVDISEGYNIELFQDFEKNHDEAIFKVPILEGELTRKRKLNDKEDLNSELSIGSRIQHYLTGSALYEEVAKFDFSDCSVKSFCWAMEDGANASDSTANQYLSKPRSVVYESDCINNHECMATVCGLIQHMVDEKIVPLMDMTKDQPIMPHWVKCIKEAMEPKERHNNVKIFLIKVMLNCKNYFSPYAKDLLMPVMDIVSSGCLGQSINYLIEEVVTMLFTWSDSITLSSENSSIDGIDASKLFKFFISNSKDQRRAMFNNNMELIRSIFIKWKDNIEIPYDIILAQVETSTESSKDMEVGLILTKLLLEHSVVPWKAENKERFLDHFLRNLEKTSRDQSNLLATAGVIGMVLRLMNTDGNGHLEGNNQAFFKSVIQILGNQSLNQKDTFLLCLYEIQKSYISIVDKFIKTILFQLPQRNGKFKTICLKIVLSRVENLERPFVELMDKGLLHWLTARVPENQEITLNMIKKCLPLLQEDELKQLMDHICSFHSHQNYNCRAAMYDILIWIFENYCQVQWVRDCDLEEGEETLWKFRCKEILLLGLEDESKLIQSKIFSFWEGKEGLKHSDSTLVRLVTIVQRLYSPTTEGSFLSYALSLLLSPSTSTTQYKEKLFEHGLAECQFRDYPLLKSWRAQHVEMIPMFADTLVSQLSQLDLSTQQNADSTLKSIQLKATQRSFVFTPTQGTSNDSRSSLWNPSLARGMDNNFEFKKPSPLQLRRSSHRWYSKFEDQRSYFAMREMKKNAKRQEMAMERKDRREREIIPFRQYRIGDFPDVQIDCSDILNPLIAVAKRDPIISQQLLVSLFSGIMVAAAESSVSHSLMSLGLECSKAFNRILKETTLYSGSLMGSVLEIGLRHNAFIKLDLDAVVSVGEPSGVSTLSCLYLEEKLNDWHREERNSRRSLYNREQANNDKETWLQLAKVYQSINEYDIVHGVFHDMMRCEDSVKEALESERAGQWTRVLHSFQHILSQPQSNDTADQERDYYYEGYYKCLANLSRWELLNHEVMKQLKNESFDDIWNDSWLSEKLLPWIFVAQVRFVMESDGKEFEEFIAHVHLWLKDKDKRDYLKTHFSKELSVLHFISGEYGWARYHAAQCFDLFLQEWSHLSPLSAKRRASKLMEIQLLSEFSMFLSAINVSISNLRFVKLCNNWKVNTPTDLECLRHWDERVALRQLYITRMTSLGMEEGTASPLIEGAIPFCLQDLSSTMTLKVIETAISLQNSLVAKKYLKSSESELKKHSDPDLRIRWNISHGFLPWVQAIDKQSSSKNPLTLSLTAWGLLEDVLHDSELPRISHLHMDVLKKMFTVSTTVSSILKENVSALDPVDEHLKEKLYKWIQAPSCSSISTMDRHFHLYSRNCLQKAIAVAKTLPMKSYVSHLYLTLATYCRSLMEESSDTYEEVCTKSLLRSMANGSVQAVQWFPCLLQFNFMNSSLSELFISEAQHVPTWMFLGWINQIFAHLNGTACSTLSDIVTRLAKVYPAAVMLPLRLYYEKYGDDTSTGPVHNLIQRLMRIFSKNTVLEAMLKSLVYICTPEVMFNYHLERIISVLDDPKSEVSDIDEAKELMMKEVFPVSCEGRSLPSTCQFHGQLLHTLQIYKKDIKEAFDCYTPRAMNKTLKAVKSKFKSKQQQSGHRVKTSVLLKDYSPWLSEFRSSGFRDCIEIPGQYTGEAEPQMEKLTKIIGFLPYVSMMTSLRRPVCITILGSDGKEHKYLIKFGEDLRLDQRIEQVFVLMNKVLAEDSLGKERGLSIITYQVIPLNNRLGMIEWVHNTKPLSDVISMSMNENEIRERKSAIDKYNAWLKGASKKPTDSENIINTYMNAFLNYGRHETVTMYEELISNFSCDILRRSFLLLSQSLEGFWSIRNSFATSHGSLCIAHWLLGIGDRHPKNTLVSTVTGRVIGIDFGYSFGSATQFLPVPELMPFRLTPQILGLMQPFGEIGLIKEVMAHFLRVQQKKCDILLATMDVFVKEPSVDWLENARRQAKTDGLSDLVESHMWYPKQKILMTKTKFIGGTNPVMITLEELSSRHKEKGSPLLEKIKEVAQGQAVLNIRATLPDRGLTCEQQVSCLIDQATDHHILGKTWQGWEPWL